MADALDSKSSARKGVWVQVPPPVLSIATIDVDTRPEVGRPEARVTPGHFLSTETSTSKLSSRPPHPAARRDEPSQL